MPHNTLGVRDLRGRFREIASAVFESPRYSGLGHKPCENVLRRIGEEPGATGRSISTERSDSRLIAGIVPGLGWDCFKNWLAYDEVFTRLDADLEYECEIFAVNGLSGSAHNASQIRDQIMADYSGRTDNSLVLFGYSKGAVDILEALVRYPEIRRYVAAMVSVAGVIGGTPLAEGIDDDTLQVLRYLPRTDCPKGDGRGVSSLRSSVRQAWLEANTLPGDIEYYTLATLPKPGEISQVLKISYRKLARFDPRNDSQVIVGDQLLPGSTFLAYLNADHWAVGVPIAEAHPVLSALFVDENVFPRQALLESAMHCISEDLNHD